jgi:hypothetical protein
MRTVVPAALQRQYLQTELILWIRLVDTIKKNTETLIDTGKEVALEVNAEKTNTGMVRSDMSKPTLILFSLQEHTQQNPLSKF